MRIKYRPNGITVIFALMFVLTLLPVFIMGDPMPFIYLWWNTAVILTILLGPPYFIWQFVKFTVVFYEICTGNYIASKPKFIGCTSWHCNCHRYQEIKSQNEIEMRTKRDLRIGAIFSTGRYA